MNYEQKYKEALEKARIYRNHLLETGDDVVEIEYIFPELINDDERIRKELIEALKQLDKEKTPVDSYPYLEWVSWLEKQSKQKPIEEYDVPDTSIKDSEVVTSRMKYIDNNLKPIAEFVIDYANWDLRKDEWNHPVATVPLFRVLDALVQKGKQYSEEYSVVDNNTEPKFKVGDWVQIENGNTIKILEVNENTYKILNCYRFEDIRSISDIDCISHLWTIEDAKDGDILLFEGYYNSIVLFQGIGINGKGRINYHCICDLRNYSFGIQGDVACLENAKHYHPATKEQRDILFQTISEAGYTWDAKTKQLIKK